MKIIKPGKHPNDDTLRGTCTRCDCVIECRRGELQYDFRDQGPGFVSCPCCTGAIFPKPKSEKDDQR